MYIDIANYRYDLNIRSVQGRTFLKLSSFARWFAEKQSLANSCTDSRYYQLLLCLVLQTAVIFNTRSKYSRTFTQYVAKLVNTIL